jgi:hypothetical protein
LALSDRKHVEKRWARRLKIGLWKTIFHLGMHNRLSCETKLRTEVAEKAN